MTGITGSRLGPFEIRSLLGTGGFATVYQAYDPRLESEVAVKILAENHSLDFDTRQRFIREAQALRRVRSPSVIGIHDIRETPDGRPYLVMELADRGTIVNRRRQLVANGWTAGPGDVVSVVEALADALDAIHAEQLIHRDVTPSNLLIRRHHAGANDVTTTLLAPDERFVLGDLGLVKDYAQSSLTVGGGTIGFAAPEQQQPLADVDRRCDIFSASKLTLWLISGLMQEDADWSQKLIDAEWSPAFVDALGRGMDPDPDERPTSIVEWRDLLLPTLDDARSLVPPFAGPVAPERSESNSDGDRGHSLRRLVAGAAITLSAAAGVWYWLAGADESPTALSSSTAPATSSSTTLSSTTVSSTTLSSTSLTTTVPSTTLLTTTATSSSTTPSSTSSSTAAPSTASPSTTLSSTTSSAPSSSSEPPPTSGATTSSVVVAGVGPEMREVFFDQPDASIRIGLVWGASAVPADVQGTEVQLSINGGDYYTELTTNPDSRIATSSGWYLYTVEYQGSRPRVRQSWSYQARVRWYREDGSVTEWSEPLTLEAETG